MAKKRFQGAEHNLQRSPATNQSATHTNPDTEHFFARSARFYAVRCASESFGTRTDAPPEAYLTGS